ncbi:hypothetical protein SynBIOSE41_02756 [Synechococcus sp. BIOS-E4-1]|nr:hypothetical protein SynBIOSE41_02756 [Synechococcus sp. BIOS-E4-1]
MAIFPAEVGLLESVESSMVILAKSSNNGNGIPKLRQGAEMMTL